ncbi:DUF6631 family protein [Dyella sp. 2RAB6]|uniref:DUF6631 family protein n=1 Tax=Dyella sp. 2RAB6 TaxID=3232992 RepID=UPI003F8E7735
MARKLRKDEPNKAPPKSGADDLSVLHPDMTVSIAGQSVTVREYGLLEGLIVRGYMRPFTADLERMLSTGSEVLTEDVMDAIGLHAHLVHRALAQSIAVAGNEASETDMQWIGQLKDLDGDRLLNTWWGVNGLFFLRQATRRVAERARRQALDGATSTLSSPPPDSDPLIDSDAIPNGSSNSSTNEP